MNFQQILSMIPGLIDGCPKGKVGVAAEPNHSRPKNPFPSKKKRTPLRPYVLTFLLPLSPGRMKIIHHKALHQRTDHLFDRLTM